jgi:YggT family protein
VAIISTFISILATVLTLAVFIRALMSWIMPNDSTGLTRVLLDVTEPVLRPIRRILPPVSGIDFSPIVAMIAIQVVSNILISLLSAAG